MITAIRAKDESQIGTTQLTVLVDGDLPEELTSIKMRQQVMQFARSLGFPASGLGTVPSPYPVDAEGKTDDELVLGKRPMTGWQAEYTVNAGLR